MTGARHGRDVILIDVTCGAYGRTMAAQLPDAMLVNFSQTPPGEYTSLLSRADVVLVGAWRDDGSHTGPLVGWLRRCNPRITIYVCDSGTFTGSLPIRALAVAGADDLISLCAATELRSVVDAIERRRSAPTPTQELRELRAALPKGTASTGGAALRSQQHPRANRSRGCALVLRDRSNVEQPAEVHSDAFGWRVHSMRCRVPWRRVIAPRDSQPRGTGAPA